LGALLRVLGSLLLIAGGIVVFLGVRRLPEALPAGTPAEIVHVAGFAIDPPRSPYLHVRGGSFLPYASLAVSEGDGIPAFFLIPLVAADNGLLTEMVTEASPAYDEDQAAVERWNTYAASRLELDQVDMFVLSTDVERWTTETSVSVETHYVEGVVRTAERALAAEIIEQLDAQFDGLSAAHAWVLYEGEVPPAEESLRLAVLLGGLAALLGLAMMVASLLARRPRWLG
jgi:hypothetical protein